jgi:hypothetical protein
LGSEEKKKMIKKYAELLADGLKEILCKSTGQSISYILKTVEENKCNIDRWPLIFEIGKEIPNNQRVIRYITETLEDGYGFIVFMQKDDYLAVDLPIEVEEIGEEIKDKSIIMSSEEAGKLSICGRESNTEILFKTIDKKIKDAAIKGENFINISSKEKSSTKDPKTMKKIYLKLKSLGFDCDDGIKKESNDKISFDKLETIKVKW